MVMKWAEVTQTPDYQKADGNTREAMRNGYFMDVVAPSIPTEHLQNARDEFDADTQPTFIGKAKEAISNGASTVADTVSKGINLAGEVYDDAQKREDDRIRQEDYARSNAVRPVTDTGSFRTPLENKINQQNLEAQQKYESSPVEAASEIARQGYAGLTIDAPAAVNKAGQAFSPDGSAAEDFFKKGAAYWEENQKDFEPNTRNKGVLVNTLASGARAIPLSGAAMAASGVSLLSSSVAAPIATAAGIAALFGGSQFTDTYEKSLQAGLPKDQAFKAGLLTGSIEGLGETAGDYMGGKFMVGLGHTFAKTLGTKEALSAATSPRWAIKFGKDFIENAAVQSGTEFGQNFGETAVENRYGISNDSPIDQGKQGAATALAMSLMMMPGAVVGHKHQANVRKLAGDLIADQSAPIDERAKAAEFIRTEMEHSIGKEAAKKWHEGMIATLGFDQADTIKKQAAQEQPAEQQTADTGDLNAATILGTPEPEQPAQPSQVQPTPEIKPAGVLGRAALDAVKQGITPLNQPTAEVSNAQFQPGAANEQPNISPAGADTNVLQPLPENSGENAGIGNGHNPVGGGLAATGTGENGSAKSTDARLSTGQQADNVARPRFNNPHEERVAAHLKQAIENGDSESVINRYMPKDDRDLQTGFFDKSNKVETVKRAQKFAEEHNTTAHFIYADLANLGGINEHFENDNDKADLIYRAEADIFRQEIERYAPDAVFKRTGGDELGATVIGATTEELQAAAEQTRIKMLEYARKNGLADIPRKAMRDKEGNILPSDPRSPFGIGMYIGIAEIKKGDTLDKIFSKASEGMNNAKMRGRNGLIYGTTDQQTEGLGEDGRNGALDRRPRGIRRGTNSTNPEVRNGVGAAPTSMVQGESRAALNPSDTGRAGTDQTGNAAGSPAAESITAAIEQLIRRRKVAGQFGLAPNLDAAIRGAKAYLKGEKFNKSLFTKTAAKFQRHDAGIATILRSVVDAVNNVVDNGTVSAPKERKAATDLIQRIKQLGGISSEYAEDFGAKDAGFNVRSAFKKGGESPDFIASQLKDEGYPISEDDLIGGLAEFVRRYVNGERSFKAVNIESAAMSERDDRAFQDLIPDAEKHGIDWRKFKSPDDLYVAITVAEDALTDAEQAAHDIALGDNDITLDDVKLSSEAEVNAWLSGENDARRNAEGVAGAAIGEQAQGNQVSAQGTGVQGEAQSGAGGGVLKSYTNAEVLKREAAAKAAEEAANKEPPAKNVTSDQVDMFNTQGGIFEQPGSTSKSPITVETHADLKAAEKHVDTDPTDAQKQAGNYSKGHINWNGLDITIENPAGSERTGTDSDGEKWSVTMPATYGYIKRTEGADGDHVDVYIGKHHNSDKVFIIDQQDHKTDKFDEHKVMLGFDTLREAERTYKAGFSDGKGAARMGAVSVMSLDEFKTWLADGDTTKPVEQVDTQQVVAKPEIIKVEDIPSGLKITIEDNSTGKTRKKLVDAKRAMQIANQRVEKYEALIKCMS